MTSVVIGPTRETTLLGNNVMLVVAAGAVLLGTLYPLLLDALGLGKISVGPPYFEAVFVPLMTPVAVLMMFGPFLRWKDDDLAAAVRIRNQIAAEESRALAALAAYEATVLGAVEAPRAALPGAAARGRGRLGRGRCGDGAGEYLGKMQAHGQGTAFGRGLPSA